MNNLSTLIYARLIALVLLVSFASSGCALFSGSEQIDPKRKDVAIVFGYIDMEDAPGDLDWVSIKQYSQPPSYYSIGARDGIFWHIGVDLGSYQVEKFGSDSSFFKSAHVYHFGTTGKNKTARRIKKPGVYYMGSYKYVHEDSGSWLKPDKFSMQPIKSPGEKELLKRLLEIIKDDSDLRIYKHQISWIEKRIAEL